LIIMTENRKCGIGLENPKGIPQQSSGLRGTSYPGIKRLIENNPERVAAHESSSTITQGSSLLRFIVESLWDSAPAAHPTNSA